VGRMPERFGRPGFVLLALAVVALALSAAWSWLGPGRNRTEAGLGPGSIRVEVWNGSGEGGVAGRLATRLRDGGYHVVAVRNADHDDYYATLVVARTADPAAAMSVARYLGGPPVIRQARGSDQADVTVVLGSDRSRLRLGSP
jgi:hypothetical protein